MNVFKTRVVLFEWRNMDVKSTEGNADGLNDDNYYELDVIFSGPVVSYQFNWRPTVLRVPGAQRV